jgi:hypothetical protein
MTKVTPLFDKIDKKSVEMKRRKLMRLMAEMSLNPANVSPSDQEMVALFLVEHLKSFSDGDRVN